MLVTSIREKNYLTFANSNFNVNFGKKKDDPTWKKSDYQEQGVRNEVLKVKDSNKLLSIKNISDAKVGSKFIVESTDPKYKGLRILFKSDSIFKSKTLPLELFLEKDRDLAFLGRVYGSIRKNSDGSVDDRMKSGYNNFWDLGMYNNIVKNYTSDKLTSQIKNDYNFFIPSDGDGSRYKDIAILQGGVTKPASYIPAQLNCNNMTLVQSVLTNFAKTNKLTQGADFIEVKPAQGSAFAFLEGIKTGKIPVDKPLVFSWGDNFSDINISKLIIEHEENKSGLTILTIPVDAERARSLGVALVNNFRDKAIRAFEEKPSDPYKYQIDELDGKILASVGPYVISPQVLQWIKDNYKINPESFLSPEGKGYDFSTMILGPLVAIMANGELTDEQDNPLRMRAKVIEKTDTWSDLGAEKDFTKEMLAIRDGGYQGLPDEIRHSIRKNVDAKGNITFDSKAKYLFKDFIKEYNMNIKNVLVYCE